MTLRDFFSNIESWFIDSYGKTVAWFSDGAEKLVQGEIFDLTIGQTVFTLVVILVFINGIFNKDK